MKSCYCYVLALLFTSFCLILLPPSTCTSTSLPQHSLRGVAPQDEKYYKSDVMKCKDGSKKFTKAQLNDEFCDCPDGTDEPGTSACPDGKFYCHNAGHSPVILFSSRVNDGICDCCDGSDEYDGKVECPNTCWEAGKAAREKLKKKIVTYREGVLIRKKEAEQSKQAYAKEEEELSKLKNEEITLKDLVQKLKERKEQVEKVEEIERLKKEKEEQRQREAEKNGIEQEKKSTETPQHEVKDIIGEFPEALDKKKAEEIPDDEAKEIQTEETTHGDGTGEISDAFPEPSQQVEEDSDNTVVKDETGGNVGKGNGKSEILQNQQEEKQDDTEGLSREALGRLVASRWTGENVDQKSKEQDSVKEVENESSPDIPDEAPDDDYDSYSSEDDDKQKDAYDEMGDDSVIDDMGDDSIIDDMDESHSSYDTDMEDTSVTTEENWTPSSPSWLEKIQKTIQNILHAVNLFKIPVDISEAAQIRKQYDDSNQKLSKIQSRISSLTEKLKLDYGLEKEFYSFYDHCFENKENKYVYKVCPFKQASQIEGHSTTRLGQWDRFEDSYRVMQFSNGDRCWNGPDRSLKVRLRCGLKNELTDVDEPSRCEYVALLSTPAVCLEEKLKELEDKLKLMNMNQPQNHDEL